jgi:hypothetical protein
VPRRADRDLADPERAASLLEHVDALAVNYRRPREVRVERIRVRDAMCVDRRREADGDDQDEEEERRERDAVPQQPTPGEAPGTLTCEFPGALAGRETYVWFRLEGKFSRALPPTSRTPGRA